MSILGVIAVASGALTFLSQERERQRARAYDRVRLSLDLMARYYEDEKFDDLRPALWAGADLPRAPMGGLRTDELRFLNYLEGIAIAVQEGAIDISLVRRMLGTPIRQLSEHPQLGTFCLDSRRSYEGIRYLVAQLGYKPASVSKD